MYKDTLRKKEDDSYKVKNYESNLKLSYDAIRKDYDNILTSIMPNQVNLIKTYLWLNTFIIGIAVIFIKEQAITPKILCSFISIFALCIISMIALVVALYYNKQKKFIFFKPEDIANIKDNKWSYAQGLINLINETKNAFDLNTEIVKFRAFYIRIGAIFLILAFMAFTTYTTTYYLLPYINHRKEVIIMPDDKPVKPDENKPITMSLSTNSQININTESINESTKENSGFNITADDKSQSDNNSSNDKDK